MQDKGKILAWSALIIVVVILLVLAFIWRPSGTPSSAKPSGGSVVNQSAWQSSGINAAMLMGNDPGSIQVTYANTNASGTGQANGMFTTTSSVVQAWQYYHDFFSKNGWGLIEPQSIVKPGATSTMASLSAWLGAQNVIVIIGQNNGSKATTVNVTSFTYPANSAAQKGNYDNIVYSVFPADFPTEGNKPLKAAPQAGTHGSVFADNYFSKQTIAQNMSAFQSYFAENGWRNPNPNENNGSGSVEMFAMGKGNAFMQISVAPDTNGDVVVNETLILH